MIRAAWTSLASTARSFAGTRERSADISTGLNRAVRLSNSERTGILLAAGEELKAAAKSAAGMDRCMRVFLSSAHAGGKMLDQIDLGQDGHHLLALFYDRHV